MELETILLNVVMVCVVVRTVGIEKDAFRTGNGGEMAKGIEPVCKGE